MGRGKAKVQVPECRYGAACTRRDCVFKHPPKPKTVKNAAPEKSDKVCFAFVAGKCAFGRQCHDKHPDEASCQTIKERYAKIDCQWGRNCRTEGCLYRHPSDEPVGPALTLELKPQPAVYAAGYTAKEKVAVAKGEVETGPLEDFDDSPPPGLAEGSNSPILAPARARVDDEEAEEQARQEQLAATLRCMGFDDETSLQAAQRSEGDLNRAVEALGGLREDVKRLDDKVDSHVANIQTSAQDSMQAVNQRLEERMQHCRDLEATLSYVETTLMKQDEDLHKEVNDRIDGVERHHSNISKETAKRLNALDLRIAGLQGASGESKRDIGKLRDEVNSLTVKSAAHDVDIGKTSDDLRKVERQRLEDNQRHKQDVDGIYEELDQKVYEKNFQSLEDNVTKLTRGTVKLCQVVGVFPGARMNDGTEEELDVDVDLLNWEDCAQNLVARVEKTWRQMSSQKYRSILDLVSKKADHSVLRLLQISQQHIESQLDRVRHERELWKEVVDKRSQQPLQLALTLKDPHTGQPLPPPQGYSLPSGLGPPGGMPMTPRSMPAMPCPGMEPIAPSGSFVPEPGSMKASPLAKRIARPAGATPPVAKA
ncbi:unnamed protein product [Effrenium voratum]|nr:unnamed protein product [Effrenium voratum]